MTASEPEPPAAGRRTPTALSALLGLFACCWATFAVDVRAQSPEQLACGLQRMPGARNVASVLDGETVRLDDGSEVRLVGALTPRASDVGAAAGTWPLEETTRAALVELVQGRTVVVTTAGETHDRHGRLLAHLFFEGEFGWVWVQGRLVGSGFARAYTTPPSHACMSALLERERAARAALRGVWTNPAYALRRADEYRELSRQVGRFVVVSGRVVRSRGTRGLGIFELVGDGGGFARSAARRDVSAGIGGNTAEDVRGGTRAGASGLRIVWRRAVESRLLDTPVTDLPGRLVIVRGWIDLRDGRPEIELIAPGQVDVSAR